MDVRWIGFGAVEVQGRRYDHDLVIDGGEVSKRKKGASKARREEYGHTPLTAAENIPWGGRTLIVGTGAYGSLPVAPDLYEEAGRRGVDVVAEPSEQAVARLRDMDATDVHAVLHITC
jgi:hypothetical protein